MDAATSQVLQQIIRETTNRINRKQKQVSENEVALAALNASIALEKTKETLFTTKAENDRMISEAEGDASGLKLSASAEVFITSLADSIPNFTDRVQLYRMHQTYTSKNVTTSNLASGQGTLFVAPQDMNLKLNIPEM